MRRVYCEFPTDLQMVGCVCYHTEFRYLDGYNSHAYLNISTSQHLTISPSHHLTISTSHHLNTDTCN